MALVSGIQYSTEITGRRNAIINGDFDVWQRGTSHSASGYGSADRWKLFITGTSATDTMSQQAFTLGQGVVPNEPKYFVRNVFSSGSDTATEIAMFQHIEGVRTFAGDTVTFSFWAKAATSLSMAIEFVQNFGTGGSPSSTVFVTSQKIQLTTSWTKYDLTFTIPSVSGKTLGTNNDDRLSALFWFSAGSDLSARTDLGLQSGTIDIAQVQVEKGDTATDFEKRSIGEEKQLCYRYYWKRSADEGSNSRIAVGGNILSASSMQIGVWLPVPMRDTPALTHGTLANMDVYDGSLVNTVSALGTAEASREIYNLSVTVSEGTLTAFRVGQLTRSGTDSDAWVAFDADL